MGLGCRRQRRGIDSRDGLAAYVEMGNWGMDAAVLVAEGGSLDGSEDGDDAPTRPGAKEVKDTAKDAQKGKHTELASALQEAQTQIQGHLDHAKQVEKTATFKLDRRMTTTFELARLRQAPLTDITAHFQKQIDEMMTSR